jgi:hypothetical protein
VVDVAAAQAGLDVRDRDLAVVGGERAGQRGGGIALDHDPVGLFVVHDLPKPGQQRRGELVERLVGAHHSEIVVGNDRGHVEHLIEHAAMLAGHADPRDEAGIAAERVDHGKQLDRFGARAEDGQDAPRGHGRSPSAERLTREKT